MQVETDEKIRDLLPGQWEEYLTKYEIILETVVLRIKEQQSLNEQRCSAGWSMHALDGIRQAVYASGEKPNFAIEYNLPANVITICVRKALSNFVRTGTLYGMLIALHQTCVGLHGVTLQCQGETVILSAPSGTGKTTLAKLLESSCDARVINGDFALLSLTEDGVWFEPTPFCGTSGVCLNERVKVDRVVFLSQFRENCWQALSVRKAMIGFMSNAFVPSFDQQLQHVVRSNIIRMLSFLKVNGYAFAPTREAAELFQNQLIRESLSSQEN